jgi:hypothetical protein
VVLTTQDRRLPAPTIASMTQLVGSAMATRRFALMLFGVFATTAVVLAAIGLYGVLAFLVRQRTHELGIRVALGATRSRLLMLVVGGVLTIPAFPLWIIHGREDGLLPDAFNSAAYADWLHANGRDPVFERAVHLATARQ